jgi:hypothetical protein
VKKHLTQINAARASIAAFLLGCVVVGHWHLFVVQQVGP